MRINAIAAGSLPFRLAAMETPIIFVDHYSTMSWHNHYTSSVQRVTFVLGEINLEKVFDVTASLTGYKDSYACYLDRKNNLYSEHVFTDENARKAEYGYQLFTDRKRLEDFVLAMTAIIRRTDAFEQEIDQLDIAALQPPEILRLVKTAEQLYADSLGYYYLTQPEYTAKLNEVLFRELQKRVPGERVQEVFLSLIESRKSTSIELERKAWLEKILIPVREGSLSESEKEKRILQHVEQYKYLPATSTFGLWQKDHYDRLLAEELGKELSELKAELEKIVSKASRIENAQMAVIRRFDLDPALVQHFETIALLGWLRLEAHFHGWGFCNYFGQVMVEQAAIVLHLPQQEVFALTLHEFYDLLEGKLSITAEHRKRIHENVLTLITPEKGFEVFWGNAAQEKFDSEIAETVGVLHEFFGQTASGTGKVQGTVCVFKWDEGDLNKKMAEFKEGQILVAGQTLPQFMPVIRKARAILTNEGGILCHAAVVSRELHKPAIIGTKIATKTLNDGDEIEMDLDTGKITVLRKNAPESV